MIKIEKLSENVYLLEDFHYLITNYVFYIGNSSVTLIGATWTPEIAAQVSKLLEKLLQNQYVKLLIPIIIQNMLVGMGTGEMRKLTLFQQN